MSNENFKVHKLDNGVPVLMAIYPDGETVTIGITYNVGGRNEWKDKSLDGISHFLEHQFFKGNDNINPLEVNQALDSLGGITNAFTTEDTTCYFTKSLSSEINRSIELWNELLTFGKISQEEFDKESFVVRQEFRRLEDNPPFLLYKKLTSQLHKGTSLEMDVIGTEESLSNVKLSQMEEYREKHYGLENAALMILGNYDKEATLYKLNQTFGKRKVRDSKPHYELTELIPPTEAKLQHVHIDKKTPLIFFGIAIKTPGGKSDDDAAMEILEAYLTLGKSSLLQEKLVRPGICAFATSFTSTHEDIGSLVLLAGTPKHMFAKAHDAAIKMLHEALTMDITEETLNKIIERMEYDYRSTEDPMFMLFNQSTDYWRRGGFKSMETRLGELRNVSVDKFKEVRDKVLKHLNGMYGTIGDIGDIKLEFPENTWEGTIIYDINE